MESVAMLTGIASIFLLILAILWCILPFAIFGFQPKIDKLLAEQKKTNQLLADVKEILSRVG